MQRWLSFFLVTLFSVCVAEGWTQESGQVVIPLSDGYIKEWLVLGPFFPDDLDMDFLAHVGGEANIRPHEGMSVTAPDGKSYTWKRYKSQSNLIDLQDAMKQLLFSLELAFQSELDDDNERPSRDLRQEFEDAGISLSQNATISIGEKGEQWWVTDRDNGQEYLIVKEEEKLNIYNEPKNAVAYVACNLLSPKAQRLEMVVERYDSVKVWLNGTLVHRTPKRNRWDTERFGIFLKKGENLCLIKVRQYIAGRDIQWGFRTQVLDYDAYLNSLRLELTVRRQNPNGRDELIISARREPQSAVWKLPALPVQIEIRDEASRLLKSLRSSEGKSIVWTVPEQAKGTIKILARQTGSSGETREGRFTCRAHSIVRVTPQVGHWKTYNAANGLGGSKVVSILQGRDGSVWFGLQGTGICRYDGHTFRIFTEQDGLPSNDVWTIFQDSSGTLWIGTMNYTTRKGAGVCRYDGRAFRTFTTRDGLAGDEVTAIYEDDQGYIWFGTPDAGVSRFDGSTFRSYTAEDGLLSNRIGAIAQDKEGHLWFGHGVKAYGGKHGATRYKGESFRTFTKKDGFPDHTVMSIISDVQGNLWFGTYDGGVSIYDGESFQNFTVAEGLVHNEVSDMFQTKSGDMWVATWGGVSRYRDGVFQNSTSREGLAHDWVWCLTEDREGSLWFGTFTSGVSQYDESVQSIAQEIYDIPMMDSKGRVWLSLPAGGVARYDESGIRTFGVEDGLQDRGRANAGSCEDRHGDIWMGNGNAIARYDGERFQTFPITDHSPGTIYTVREDKGGALWIGTRGKGGIYTYREGEFSRIGGRQQLGPGWSWISYIIEDSTGNIWFSMPGYGVGKYDGEQFTTFTEEDGLSGNIIFHLTEDREGNIWIATQDGGACWYDGEGFQTLTTEDGLAENDVHRVFEDSDGNLWFSVATGGVHKFDGRNFQTFTTEDGLLSNFAWGILEDKLGNMIFATSRGITTYTPPEEKIPPPAFVTEVVADKVYPAPVGARGRVPLQIPSTTPRVSFSYYGMSYKTKRMRYNYMLEGYDADWQATWDEEVSYEGLKPGDYVFKVIAITRDLVYSEAPATVHLAIVLPFYLRGVFLIPTIGSGTILLATLVILATALTKRRRQVHAYQQAAVRELHDAREMQMSLLPESALALEGFDIAGFSQPAREVGGDFFDYLSIADGKIGIALADISGKGLKGAMNAVMTDGMLHEVATIEESCGKILSRLNAGLYSLIEKRTFVALELATLEENSMKLQWANAAQPYPIVKRGKQVFESKSDSELPLGMMPNVAYPDWELELQAGDIVVFYTDGIIEAENEAEEMYGAERLEQVIMRIDSTMKAEEIIEALLQDVTGFAGSAEQYDDMTVVVVKKL